MSSLLKIGSEVLIVLIVNLWLIYLNSFRFHGKFVVYVERTKPMDSLSHLHSSVLIFNSSLMRLHVQYKVSLLVFHSQQSQAEVCLKIIIKQFQKR